ncbi:MAG: magnesium transporter [bacterium]|nr:magnesium transporter [bacterium]
MQALRALRDTGIDSPARAAGVLGEIHPADAAEWLQDLDDGDAWHVFVELDTGFQAEILEFADEGLINDLAARMSAGDLRSLVEELPSDDAVDLLAEADERVAEDVLDSIPVEDALVLRELSAYPPDTAGGVMKTEFVNIQRGTRVGDAVKEVKKEGEEAEDILGVFILDEEQNPVGFLSDRSLLTHSIHDLVEDVMVEPFTIDANADQEEAANQIQKYSLSALGVVGPDGALVGVISAEDAAEILEEEAREDIQRLVGTTAKQQTRLPVLVRTRQRMPLMAVTVLGGLVSAKILSYFLGGDETGGDASILRYLPLIIGLAGNVGIQSSTILVRGFATGEVEPEREGAVLLSELTVGTLVGLICGGVTIFIASWMEAGTWIDLFGVAVGTAIAVAVSWAAFLGCAVPVSCRRLGIDPAIVAGPALITLSDISGSLIYILVARQLVGF